MEQEKILQDDEEVIIEAKKHWIVYVEDIFVHLVGCLLFFGIAVFLSIKGGNYGSYFSLLFGVMLLISWTSFFFAWTKNYFDVWYITNRHIVAVNQKDIFKRENVFVEYSRIQDVVYEKNGFISTLLGYGKLRIENAGVEQELEMHYVSDVEVVAQVILKRRDEVKDSTL